MYESFFGLTKPPFRLIPDPSFLFVGKGHRDAFAALRVGLTAGARVMVLTGEVGAGKTTLLQALLASVDPASTVTAHISAAHLDAETLSERLCEALRLPPQPDPLARRDALLTALSSGPQATFMVIDEAQHLAPGALDLLETLANTTALAPARLQICLVGQPELRILLNAAQRNRFRGLIGVDRHLGPLEQAEIRLYVEHRLHRAGWTGRPEFEDAAFSEIFIFTAGNPRRVNLLCNSLMLCACLRKQQRIDAPAVTWAAAAMREDSFQGAPDLLDLGSHFEHRPTLTEAFEPDAPELEAATRREDTPAWSCPSCGGLNASTAMRCGSCEAARPTPDAVAESSCETSRASEDTVAAAPDAVQVAAAARAQAADDRASLTTSEGPSDDVEVPQSDPIDAPLAAAVPRRVSAARRRRQAVLAGAASATVALALLAYVLYQQRFEASLSQNAVRDIVANGTRTSTTPTPGPDSLRRATGSISPASSAESSVHPPSPEPAGHALAVDAAAAKTPPDGDQRRGRAADEVPGAAGAAPERALPVTPAPAGTPPPCSGPAFALGLCDADSSPTRRQ
jgi:type II secretory pathway predicted ATPase ExeA